MRRRFGPAAALAGAMLLLVIVESAIAGDAAPPESSSSNSNKRLFAYLDTRNEDGSKRRSHVFALLESGTLSERVTSMIKNLRRQQPSTARYGGKLNFTTTRDDVTIKGKWAVENRFSFNEIKLEGPRLASPVPFQEQDYDDELWHCAHEIGGFYLAYDSPDKKNLLQIFHDKDMAALEHNENGENRISFQTGFHADFYVVWTLGNITENGDRFRFKQWFETHKITQKYGYVYGERKERNGYIRLGQQVCDPPSDCDIPWAKLLDVFAETAFVEDIRFSDKQPYGEVDEDLRFLYPGDDVIRKKKMPPLMYSYTIDQLYWVLPAWILLMFAPKWKYTHTLTLIPSFVHIKDYLVSIVMSATSGDESIDLGSLTGIYMLIKQDPSLCYMQLAFDLWLGRWISHDATMRKVDGFMWHSIVIPVLVFTFLSGPVGWIGYFIFLAPMLLPPRIRRVHT